MSGKQRRLQRERRMETFKLMQEARRDKYKDVIDLQRNMRGELVNICRSGGGGAEPYNYNAAMGLVEKGCVVAHKNLSGYFVATPTGRVLFGDLTRAHNQQH